MTPQALDFEMQLDLLVDGELPEEDRRVVLTRLTGEDWRTLALRFLQRQTERTAVRQLINHAAAAEHQPILYRFRPGWRSLRAVAAMFFVGAVGLFAGSYLNRPATPPDTAAGTETVQLPATVVANHSQPLTVEVPLVRHDQLPRGYPFANANADESTRHLMIVPQGKDHAVVFPVTTVATKPEIIY